MLQKMLSCRIANISTAVIINERLCVIAKIIIYLNSGFIKKKKTIEDLDYFFPVIKRDIVITTTVFQKYQHLQTFLS